MIETFAAAVCDIIYIVGGFARRTRRIFESTAQPAGQEILHALFD
jgi:hypothetical protein